MIVLYLNDEGLGPERLRAGRSDVKTGGHGISCVAPLACSIEAENLWGGFIVYIPLDLYTSCEWGIRTVPNRASGFSQTICIQQIRAQHGFAANSHVN
jgi:hypothetical protein